MLKKVKEKSLSFSKHPCKELSEDMKVHYLNALSLIMNADDDISEKELEYIKILISSFDLEENRVEEFIEFAKNPTEDAILGMINAFPDSDIKYNLIIDAMMIASRDGNFDETEQEAIEQYFEMFKISPKEKDELNKVFEIFMAQDGNALFRYFRRGGYLKEELFSYLIEYYKLEAELDEYEKDILNFKFFKPVFKDKTSLNNAEEILSKPVNNSQYLIFLNEMYIKGAIEIDGIDNIVDSNTKDLILNPENSDIRFEEDRFVTEDNKLDEKVTGITYTGAETFIAWISRLKGENYALTNIKVAHIFSGGNAEPDLTPFEKYPIGDEIGIIGNPYRIIHSSHVIKKDFTQDWLSFRFMKLVEKNDDSELTDLIGDMSIFAAISR